MILADPTPTDVAPPAPTGAGVRVLVVRAGRLMFGVALGLCTEVLSCERFTPLPGSEPCVRGLINLRGRLVTVVDLARWARAADAETEASSVVIVDQDGRRVGLAVDEVVAIVSDLGADVLADGGAVPAVSFRRARCDDPDDGELVFGLLDTDTIFRPLLA